MGSGFNHRFDDAMKKFYLLRSRLGEERVDLLSDFTRIFFAFQKQ